MKKTKTITALILAALLSFSAVFSASATTYFYSSGYELYKDDNSNGWIINSCSLEADEISLPERLLDDSVTTIGGMSFQNRSTMTYVFIPDSFTTIGAYAFSGCTLLSDIVFSRNLKYIYVGAFRYCDSITDVDLSHTKLTLVGNTAFYDCDLLESVILPDTLESIGANAFANCPKLNKILIGKNVNSISTLAFNNSPNTVICCYYGSYAHNYAVENKIDHMILDRQPGDVNGDGVVDIFDATEIQKYAAERTDFDDEQFARADLNHDGYVDVMDALLVQKSTVGMYEIPEDIIRY